MKRLLYIFLDSIKTILSKVPLVSKILHYRPLTNLQILRSVLPEQKLVNSHRFLANRTRKVKITLVSEIMGYYWAVNLLKVLTINTSSYWMSKSEMGDCNKHNVMDYLKDQPTGVSIFPHTT